MRAPVLTYYLCQTDLPPHNGTQPPLSICYTSLDAHACPHKRTHRSAHKHAHLPTPHRIQCACPHPNAHSPPHSALSVAEHCGEQHTDAGPADCQGHAGAGRAHGLGHVERHAQTALRLLRATPNHSVPQLPTPQNFQRACPHTIPHSLLIFPAASPSIVESNTRTLDRLIVKDTPEPSEPSTWDMLRDMWSKVSVPHGQTHRETPLSPKASERAARPAVSLPV